MKDFSTLWGTIVSRNSFLSKRAKNKIMKGQSPLGTRGLNELHALWTNEDRLKKSHDDPVDYANTAKQSEYLLEQIKSLPNFSNKSSILEIGCNVGRNLNTLLNAGYSNLSGIEINPKAISLMKEYYPELAKKATIYQGSVENEIKKLAYNQFELTFSNAVLMHIHPSSNWIFKEIDRITSKYIRVHEVENLYYDGVFPRDYKKIFEELGWIPLRYQINNWKNEPEYVMRLFSKQKTIN